MSISTNFNNTRPSLLLDFANSQQLDPRVTFSRSTTAPYYDGKTSVLAEQNLLIQSNTFSNAAWVATSATIASGVTDPAGGTTAYSMTATAGNATLYQTLTLTATAYTESIWIQRVTGTGTINLTLDGTTLSPVTITGSWAKYTYTATPTAGAKTIGIQIVTSGDAINIYGSQIENRSSATATNITTTSAITNYIPQLLTAPINAPRFDFNPTTGESLGLLIEQSSTNLLTYSQLFNNAAWNNNGGSVSINATAGIAPDGTQTANLVTESTGTTEHHVAESYTFSASTAHTASIYIKQVYGSRNIRILFYTNSAADQATVIFNASNGAVVSAASAVGSMTAVSATATLLGNGFWRFTLTGTTSATAGAGAVRYQMMNGTTASYTGDGWSSLFYWQAQLEALAFATSPIATTSAQVTRASDNASMTGTNFSSWYNQGQGTVYTEANYVGGSSGSVNAYYSIDDGTTNNRLTTQIFGTNGFATVTNNSIQANLIFSGTPTVNTFYKQASSYANNNFIFSVNGQTALTSSTGLVPNNLTTLNIGKTFNANYYLNGRMKKFAYYPQSTTATNVQSLSGS